METGKLEHLSDDVKSSAVQVREFHVPLIFESQTLARKWVCSTIPFEAKIGERIILRGAGDGILAEGIITKIELPGNKHGYPELKEWYKIFYRNALPSIDGERGSATHRATS